MLKEGQGEKTGVMVITVTIFYQKRKKGNALSRKTPKKGIKKM